MISLSILLLGLGASARAQTQAPVPGSIVESGSTLVTAMMVFLGNEHKVYILDKSQNNPQQINGHAAWASVWDIDTHTSTLLDVHSNPFCATGAILPDGRLASFGGNHAVQPSATGPQDFVPADPTTPAPVYLDYDGRKAVRTITPCTGDSASFTGDCQWFENATDPTLVMAKERWYASAEALGDGSVALIGGMVSGGYINRLTGSTDPVTHDGVSQNNFEFYPARPNFTPQTMQFLVTADGLNLYAHSYLMASGKMFLQANVSTILWDPYTFEETPLPDMPGGVIRTYPSSGATAMLPLTPANNWTQTVLFCGGGGNTITDAEWGDQSGTNTQNWLIKASTDCHRITPEPADGSAPVYVQDDDLPVARSMGQSILLPDMTMLIVHGGEYGNAAYDARGTPYGQSLATGPVMQPVIYTPTAPAGTRFSSAGLGTSKIPRLYHSSAILLPDASVWLAGSNPNADYNGTTIYPTEYRSEMFYPPYFQATRPAVSGIPTSVGYGGAYFNVTVDKASYSGDANAAAGNASVVLVRTGFTTHAVNFGQRLVQLDSTYSVAADGTITLHVAQAPPNANLLSPGPALFFVVVNGIPSLGKMITVGSGKIETQPTATPAALPPSAQSRVAVSGGNGSSSAQGGTGAKASGKSELSRGAIIAIAAGGGGALLALAAIAFFAVRARSERYRPVYQAHARHDSDLALPMQPRFAADSTAALVPGAAHYGVGGTDSPYRDLSRAASPSGYRDASPARR